MAKLISVVVLAFFLAAGMPLRGDEAISVDQPSSDQASGNGAEQQAVKKEKKSKKSKAKKDKKGKKNKKGKKGKKGKKNKKPKKEKAAAEPAEDNASDWVQPEGSAQ